jgi:tetratricopeptide (TPR) repeat protein
VADFTHFGLKRPRLAVELARAALALNPWYSGLLWNAYGDALFSERHIDDAHRAYLAAQRINPTDLRAKLGLAYTWPEQGAFDSALETVAEALALDRDGLFRERLLSRQQELLHAMDQMPRPTRGGLRVKF